MPIKILNPSQQNKVDVQLNLRHKQAEHEVNFTVPLFDFLSVKLAFNLINDSNPNPDVGNNKTTTKLLFGVDF